MISLKKVTCIVVNWVLPSLHEGSRKITRIVPLNSNKIDSHFIIPGGVRRDNKEINRNNVVKLKRKKKNLCLKIII